MIDKARYEKEVLGPAADNASTPPVDLFTRYGFHPSRRPSDDGFAQQTAEMVKLWRAFGVQRRRYRPITEALLAAHAELSEQGLLTWEHFASAGRARSREAQSRLRTQIAELAAGSPCVSAATVRRLAAGSGGSASESEVAGMLLAEKVRIVDPLWKLPDAPPGGRSLRTGLRTLGLDLSADLLFGKAAVRRGFRLHGGFRLAGGERLTPDLVADKKDKSRSKAFDSRKSSSDSVFSVLEKAARDGVLDELLVWEITEVLRESVEAQMPFRLVAGEAKALGLEPVEAEDLTLSLIERRAGAAAGRGAVAEVETALAEGRLREAERLRGALGDDQAELRARIDALGAQVARASDEAVRALSAGRSEEAAELLAGALRIAADDDALAQRLAAVPPPPAADVLAGADGGRIAVSWRPGAARAGRIVYRVVRTANGPASSASAGQVVVETQDNDVVDTAPPAAVSLHYTVFARRDEGSWSAPAASRAVRCLPEVGEVSLTADEHAVRASWTPHRDVAEAEVVRIGDSRTVKAARDGFTDTGIRPGHSYRYRIRAVYRTPSGKRETTPGIEVSVTSETAPREVTELKAAAEGTDLARVTWRDPGGGRVVVRVGSTPPPWTQGDALSADQASGYGHEVTGTPVPQGDGRFSLTAPLGADRRYFAAVTVGGGRAVAGPSASVRIASPVRDLTVRRFPARARLSWIWPEGATSALIGWTPRDGGPGSTTELSLRAYRDNGGCVLEVGSSAGRVEVRALTRDAEGVIESPPAGASVTATGLRVGYEFRRRRRPFRADRAVLRLTAEEDVLVPALDVVHGTGHTQPLRRDQGEIVHRTDESLVGPNHPHEMEFDVPKSSRSWLVCFGPDDGSVILVRLRGNW